MSLELPAGWVAVTLEDIVTKLVDGSHNPPKKQTSGLPMASAKNIRDGDIDLTDVRLITAEAFEQENSRTQVLPGDILLTIVGAIGRTAVVHDNLPKFTLQRSVAVVRPESVDSSFIAYTFESPNVQKWLDSKAKGTAQKGVYLKTLRQMPLGVPPLLEQKRIVKKINHLKGLSRRARAALEAVEPLLEKFRQSVLAAAFRGDLTADWRAQNPDVEPASKLLERVRRERRQRWEEAELEKMRAKGRVPRDDRWKKKYKEPGEVDRTGLPDLPEGWDWATLEHLKAFEPNSLTDGPFGSKLKTADYVQEGIRVIRLGNIGVGEFKDENTAYISQEKYLSLRKHEIFPGDLVIAALAEPVGRATLVPTEVGKAIVKADCIRMKPLTCFSNLYLMHCLNSPDGRSRAELLSHGVGRLRINMANMRSLPIPVAPLAEQALLVTRVEGTLCQVNELKQTQAALCHKLNHLDQSILTQAFQGQLVPQDPNDEPASVLLERIRKAREAQAKAKKGRRRKRS